MDTTALAAQLRAAAGELRQRAERLETAAAALGEPPANGTAKRGGGRGREIDWDRMRQQYENTGTPVARIADAFKVSDATVYARAKAYGWERPEAAP